ncbi:MAG: ATP-dependent helicase [Eubacteriales bacterium]|nr:ATP-dependent helicase [Eubacteriales bacterium]
MKLSEAQYKAVQHREGPALILAGPGSGKTTVITQRTKFLIEEYQIPPSNILVVTFTRAAATQMKQRFLTMCRKTSTPVRFGTFHSVFFEILKHAYHYTAANILGEEQKYTLIREIAAAFSLDTDDEAEMIKNLIREISTVKSEQIALDHYYSSTVSEEVFRKIFTIYVHTLQQKNLLDYDDLMVYTWELLTQRPDILQGWQRRYRYILIDEFQDINQLQYRIIRLLAAPENNLFVVGDDDQSIYRFRGARPELMLNFKKEYPEAAEILLDENFRCSANITEAAATVIGRNITRFQKKIRAVKPQGAPIEYQVFANETEECLGLIRNIQKFYRAGIPLEEMAILFRNNTDARIPSQKLMEYNVPFRMRDALPNIYEHWIAQDMIAYLRAAQGDLSRKNFLRIMNRPKRYLSRECLDQPTVDLERLRRYYDDKYWVVQRIDQLEADLRSLNRMKPFMAVKYIRQVMGYDDFLREYAEYRKMNADELLDVCDQVMQSADGHATLTEWFAHIEEYSEFLKEHAKEQETLTQAVTLTTLHSAKGLEYRVVFIIDVNEGVIPYKKAIMTADIEEERRMFYVGMTRASEHLLIYSVKEKNGRAVELSPFISTASQYAGGRKRSY